jgi:RNA recognition motif-containing protein
MAELKDVKQLLEHNYLSKEDAPKATTKGWGKPPVAQTVAPVQSLLEIEAEQKKEKEKQDAEQKKPGTYQPKHGAGTSYSSPSSGFGGSHTAGSYSRPERTDGPTTSFESYSRENRGPRQHVPIPNSPPYTAYIGNLPFNVTEDSLADFFQGLDVKDIRLVKLPDGRSKGFAFVEFETVDGLTQSLTANGGDFGGRNMTVEVQPPRTGGSYGASSFGSSGEADDKGRWGPSSGQGPASTLGSQTQARTFDRDSQGGGRSGGSYVPRTQHGERPQFGVGGSDHVRHDFGGGEDRQWRGNPRPEPVHQQPVSNVRPKLDLKPRTVTDDSNRVTSSSASEDPFGGPVDQDKLKKQGEMQAKREAEAAAKHKLNQPASKDDKEGGFRSQGGRNEQQHDSGAWRSNRNQEEREQSSSGDNKYRFNKGGNDQQQQRAPQRNFDNKSGNNHQNQSANTFQSLASGGRDKW